MVFFSLCTIVGLWRLIAARGPVVTISPDGIRDTRVAAEFIPWNAVTAISTWKFRGQEAMVLAVLAGDGGSIAAHADGALDA